MAMLDHDCLECGHWWASNQYEDCPECGSSEVASFSDESPFDDPETIQEAVDDWEDDDE